MKLIQWRDVPAVTPVTITEGVTTVLNLVQALQGEIIMLQSQCVNSERKVDGQVLDHATSLLSSLNTWRGALRRDLKQLTD